MNTVRTLIFHSIIQSVPDSDSLWSNERVLLSYENASLVRFLRKDKKMNDKGAKT